MCGTFLPCSRVAMAVLISSTISKMPGASAAARGGLTVEDGAHRAGEAGQHIQAVERAVIAECGDRAVLRPALGAELEGLSESLRADIVGPATRTASDRSEQLERIGSALTQIPSFDHALAPPTLAQIGMAAQPRRPLVYLGSAPGGSFAIIVDGDGHGRVELEAIRAPGCSSRAIAHLALGLDADGASAVPAPYLAARAHSPEPLDAAIEALSPLIGDHLLRPLAGLLADREASGVTLVAAGILGLMPLHAISWNDAAGRRCLLDHFDVALGLSARLQLACMSRASRTESVPVRFVGIANPLPHPDPLEGAEFEMDLVEPIVRAADVRVLRGEEATKERVLQLLPSATHVHFACHGKGQLSDAPLSGHLSLSDGTGLSAREIARLRIDARLVVASACETGVPQGYREIDESLGLASAFVAAGAAGVVSTLWSVRDFPTALIISRFYEGVFLAGKPPAVALREAQVWLRDADEAAVQAYASGRASLRTLLRGRRAPLPSDRRAPYRVPSFWAAFVFSGA